MFAILTFQGPGGIIQGSSLGQGGSQSQGGTQSQIERPEKECECDEEVIEEVFNSQEECLAFIRQNSIEINRRPRCEKIREGGWVVRYHSQPVPEPEEETEYLGYLLPLDLSNPNPNPNVLITSAQLSVALMDAIIDKCLRGPKDYEDYQDNIDCNNYEFGREGVPMRKQNHATVASSSPETPTSSLDPCTIFGVPQSGPGCAFDLSGYEFLTYLILSHDDPDYRTTAGPPGTHPCTIGGVQQPGPWCVSG